MRLALGLMACTLCLGIAVRAQNGQSAETEYQSWMKSTGATAANLGKDLTAKNGAAAKMDARTLQENMSKVMIYWQSRNVSDAVRFALDAKYGLAQVDLLASQGKFEDAAAALKTAQANCGSCHMAHREKQADGSWKIK